MDPFTFARDGRAVGTDRHPECVTSRFRGVGAASLSSEDTVRDGHRSAQCENEIIKLTEVLLVIIALITNEYYQSSLISTQYSF